MEKLLIEIFNLLTLAALLSFPFIKIKWRGYITLGAISTQVIVALIVAFSVFTNGLAEYAYPGSWVTGEIPIRIDYLSAWFILLISFTFLTGAWYGFQYLKKYKDRTASLTLHAAALMMAYSSMIDICVVQNGFAMLVVWEIMAISSFIIVIFEHEKKETLKAGINFLIQSHVSILFLTVAFIWVKVKTGSFDFEAITSFTQSQSALTSLGLFLFFLVGFAIKSGFVPFHTWLPLAHPVAPAHVSGIMSGVIIKIGIYGILRMLLLIQTDMTTIGYFIVAISVFTGVYGVMLAIVQHNFKKLLAYHSIENIGIIGIGIGLGCLGLGAGNNILAICGFGGALLHTLNHSLFKSLLFYCSGNVYQATHTMDIEKLGGLIKKMPHTAYLFLLGALAICGLPPFNGFVSEFFIYSGLFQGITSAGHAIPTLFYLFAVIGLALIGGLALICFTKVFGIIFLGTPRDWTIEVKGSEKPLSVMPLYLSGLMILLIGVVPFLLAPWLVKTIQLYIPSLNFSGYMQLENLLDNLTSIGWYSLGFIVLTAVLFGIRHLIVSGREDLEDNTWGCGYTGDASKMQYTASSFVRTYRKLAEPALLIRKEKQEATGLYPVTINQVTHPGDKLEKWLIDKPLGFVIKILNSFAFLQNGKIQAYILYGIIFVGLAILLPIFAGKIDVLIQFLNQL
ncbi:MAG: proton-conducting transporter membrane subunit [Bacteroidales bacterium]|nr:proton-conducting transporter membrane subunit [Bacteroidales bacterium]